MALTNEDPAIDIVESRPEPVVNQQDHHHDGTLTPPVKEDETRKNPIERFELETFTPFSSCHLWKLMSSFYDRQGVDSWAQGIVPHFITSNTFIAKRYVQVFIAYLRDAISKLNANEPLYIVELGTGSGKFSYYFLQWLDEMSAIVNLTFPLHQIRYVMTDFTDSNLKFWQSHPALSTYVQRGCLDFAIFDATRDTSLHLLHSNQSIVTSSLRNPICVVANYLFDTLHHELFRVELGVLKQGLVSVGSSREFEKDPLDPEIIKRLNNLFQYDPITTNFYENDHINSILRWYSDYYKQSPATFLVPIGAVNAIERLKALSRNDLLILSGDKGHTNPDHFRGLQDPHIAVHGSFSVMVNYHAIGIYVTHRGGFALHNPQEEASLKVSVFVVPSDITVADTALEELSIERSNAFPNLRHVYDDTLVSFGPNDFFVMQKALKEDAKAPSLKGVIALMKLSFYDSDLFYKFREVFLDQSPNASSKIRLDVMACLKRTWSHYYQLDKEKDIAFEIGRVYYGMREYDEALQYYTKSLEEMGKHHVTYHNMGLCYYSTRRLPDAMRCFEAATVLNACYQKAATWLQRVKTELDLPIAPLKPDPLVVNMQQIDLEVQDVVTPEIITFLVLMSFFSNLAKEVSDPEFLNKIENLGNQLIDTHLNEDNKRDSSAPAPIQDWNHTKHSNNDSNKKALFIGINYFDTDAELRGCIKDVENLSGFVREQCGFSENDIRRLTDNRKGKDRPTRANILAGMRWLVENARPGDSLFFHYSGHGSQQDDEDGDEADGTDETICPVDYETAGMITDDEMHAIMCAPLPAGCKLTAIFDCCHSGSALDLPYMYTIDGDLQIHEQSTAASAKQLLTAGLDFLRGNSKKASAGFRAAMNALSADEEDSKGPVAKERIKDRETVADVVLFSGCKDTQTSADAEIEGSATGALSYAFISTMKKHRDGITYKDLLKELREFMYEGYTQIPCLSAGRPMSMDVTFRV